MAKANGDENEIDTSRALPRFTAEELFRGKTPEEWRTEYVDAFDWGPDIGHEIGEEWSERDC